MNSAEDTQAPSLDELARSYDVHDPRIQRCHFEVLKHMRDQGPVHYAETYGGHWVVVGYEEVWEAASQPHLFSSAEGVMQGLVKEQRLKPVELDPPQQRPWRRLLTPFFTQRAADSILEPMGNYADSLIASFIGSGRINLIDAYARPMENHAFFRLLMDFTEEQADFCIAAVNDALFSDDPDSRAQGWARIGGFGYDVWDSREEQPSDGGFVDTVRTALIDGEPVTRDDFAGWMMLMISGGSDTTPFAIGSLFIHLTQYPDMRRRAQEDPAFLRTMIDESLRHQSPSVMITRTVTQDVTFGGQQMHAGDKVNLIWASADRDSALCERADDFDPDRPATRHVAFGAGVHRCIAERQARAVMFAAAERFLARIPDFELDESEPIRYRMSNSRGPVNVPLLFPVRRDTPAGEA